MTRRLWAPATEAERWFAGQWVAERIAIAGIDSAQDFVPYEALGVLVDERLAAVVLWHGWQPARRVIEMTMAADTPAWASRKVILALLAYPFDQLGVNRIGVAVPHDNQRAIKLDKGVGFREEGVLRDAFGPRSHAVVMRMLRPDYLALQRKWASDRGKKIIAKGPGSVQDSAGADAGEHRGGVVDERSGEPVAGYALRNDHVRAA